MDDKNTPARVCLSVMDGSILPKANPSEEPKQDSVRIDDVVTVGPSDYGSMFLAVRVDLAPLVADGQIGSNIYMTSRAEGDPILSDDFESMCETVGTWVGTKIVDARESVYTYADIVLYNTSMIRDKIMRHPRSVISFDAENKAVAVDNFMYKALYDSITSHAFEVVRRLDTFNDLNALFRIRYKAFDVSPANHIKPTLAIKFNCRCLEIYATCIQDDIPNSTVYLALDYVMELIECILRHRLLNGDRSLASSIPVGIRIDFEYIDALINRILENGGGKHLPPRFMDTFEYDRVSDQLTRLIGHYTTAKAKELCWKYADMIDTDHQWSKGAMAYFKSRRRPENGKKEASK